MSERNIRRVSSAIWVEARFKLPVSPNERKSVGSVRRRTSARIVRTSERPIRRGKKS